MHRVNVLHTTDLAGGTAPFETAECRITFHRLMSIGELPVLDGPLWAFIDWAMPQISGLELCRRMRCDPRTAEAHITILIDEGDPESGRRAMRAGADDYLIGRPSRTEILDRLLASQTGLTQPTTSRLLTFGELTIDVAAFQARWEGRTIPLMPNEFRLLRFLVEHPGRVFTRFQLIEALGKQDPPIDERTVDVWVGRLRRALRQAGAGDPLRTVRSLGYILDRL